MATWIPILGIVPQATESGNQANGMVLKFYEIGTVTPLAVATDSTGGTTTTEFVLNTAGYTTLSDVIVIPHVSTEYKEVLYLNQADATANDTGSAVYVIDNISLGDAFKSTLAGYANLALALAGDDVIGSFLSTAEYTTATGIGGNTYKVVAGGTGTADGGAFINKTDGSGDQLQAIFKEKVLIEQYGATMDGATDDSSEVIAATAFCSANALEIASGVGTVLIASQIDLGKVNFDFKRCTFKLGVNFFASSGSSTSAIKYGTGTTNIVKSYGWIYIDGNVANQTTDVISFEMANANSPNSDFKIWGFNASTHCEIGGNSERITIHVGCSTSKLACHVHETGGNTPDEINILLTGDNCEQYLVQEDGTSVTVNLQVEQQATTTLPAVQLLHNKFTRIIGEMRGVSETTNVQVDMGNAGITMFDLALIVPVTNGGEFAVDVLAGRKCEGNLHVDNADGGGVWVRKINNGWNVKTAVNSTKGNPSVVFGETSGTLMWINVDSSTANFNETETISISGGGGSGATAIPIFSGSSPTAALVGVAVTGVGSGFTSDPTVSVSGGTGTATLSGQAGLNTSIAARCVCDVTTYPSDSGFASLVYDNIEASQIRMGPTFTHVQVNGNNVNTCIDMDTSMIIDDVHIQQAGARPTPMIANGDINTPEIIAYSTPFKGLSVSSARTTGSLTANYTGTSWVTAQTVGLQSLTSATNAELSAIGNAVNTEGKYHGRPIWNTTQNIPIYASGDTAGSLWRRYSDNVTANTPV